jgi:hypothetical protein
MIQRIRLSCVILTCTALVAVATAGSAAKAETISVSTDVLNGGSPGPGNVASGTMSPTNEINYVEFIPNSANPLAVQYDYAGNTVNLAPNIYAAGAARGSTQGIQVNTYGPIAGSNPPGDTNMFLAGQANTNNPGFGAHANWVVTLNLDAIRAANSLAPNTAFDLTGEFGPWGAIGPGMPLSSGGNVQGEIWLNGTRIDSMPQASFSPANDPTFNLNIPGTGHELSFFILNSPTSSFWDDSIFENVNLATVPVPEPSSVMALAGMSLLGLAGYVFRRHRG